ncbi:hypothetical protein MPR_1618 [Myroides profundi]|nr:hypothetical protein MPR_1618 [Myroides profundi]
MLINTISFLFLSDCNLASVLFPRDALEATFWEQLENKIE